MTEAAAPARGEDGFSLVEMLVALAVVALMASLLAAAVGQAGLVRTRQAEASRASDDMVSVQMLLRGRLERVWPVVNPATGSGSVDVAGLPDLFDFVGQSADRQGPYALQRYRLTRAANGDLVLRSGTMLNPDADPRDPASRAVRQWVLARGTAGLRLQYFGPTQAEEAPVWQDNWVNRPANPQLIRVAVAFPAGDQRQWPDFVVRPRSTGGSGEPG